MNNESQDPKSGLILREKYRKEMEALNLSLEEYLQRRKEAEEELLRLKTEKYLQENPTPTTCTKWASLNSNVENVGFERHFFTREDAEFVVQQQDKWEEENSIWEPTQQSEEEKENLIQTLTLAGVRYDFKNIDVSIFATWRFDQVLDSNGGRHMEYGYIFYYYNHFSKEFREINSEDYFEIDFSV